jgi:hypothetical protein
MQREQGKGNGETRLSFQSLFPVPAFVQSTYNELTDSP